MSEILERILLYALGGIIGLALGFIVLAIDMEFLRNENHAFSLIIASLLGILVSIAIHETAKSKLLKSSKEIHDESIALISHEMRTGLTSTSWIIELMLNNYGDKMTPGDRKMLEEVIESIRTTVMHSVNLLDVSLLDIGKLTISMEEVALREIEDMFRHTIGRYELGAKRNDIKLTTSITLDPDRKIEVDKTRLRIVLENLFENALQYTKGNVRELYLEVKNTKDELHLMMRDTGIGIPCDEQEKIFGEFYRATNARKNLSTGSGIGLYTTHEYIKAHNGTIRFESEEDKGTTFFITLPLKAGANVNEFLTKI